MKLLLLLSTLAALATASPLAPRWGTGGPKSLGGLAEGRGRKYFGTEISSYYRANKPFDNILRSEFNQITPENEMKWEVIQPERGIYNWTGSDLILQTVQETKSYFRGHNFCWDSQTPEYVTNITDPDELKAVLKEHIDAVMGRYGEHFYAFDVINERESRAQLSLVILELTQVRFAAFNENGTIKSSVWYDVLGESYLETAVGRSCSLANKVAR